MAKKKKKLTEADKRFLDQVSVFEKEHKKLSKMVGHKAGEHVESQQISIQAIRASIDMILTAIPKAEKVFNKYRTERSAYSMVSIVNLLRELLRDLAALSGFSQIGSRILEAVVEPALLNSTQMHISGLKDIRQYVYEKVDDRKVRRRLLKKIDGIIEQQANHVAETRQQVSEQIEALVEKGGVKK